MATIATVPVPIPQEPVRRLKGVEMQQFVSLDVPREGDACVVEAVMHPRTGGRMTAEQRRRRLAIWSHFINEELESRNMRPAQLALYANVNASTVSVWRHGKSLPDREAVGGVARCFRLPVEFVAEKAGMLPPTGQRVLSRIETDAEWRALLADIDRLPHEQFSNVKAALRLALGAGRRRRAG